MKKVLPVICTALLFISCASNVSHKTTSIQETLKPEIQLDSCEAMLLVPIDTSFSGLRIYYPSCASVGLAFGDEPDNEYMCFVCAAAYTGKTVYQNKPRGVVLHSDIAGKHIYDGSVYDGYDCDNNTGGFVSYGYNVRDDGILWEILNREDYLKACSTAPLPHSAFGQELLIYKGEKQPFVRKDRPSLYRALCRLNNRLCVIDGTHPHLLVSFVDLLLNTGVTDALYLDMGDWKYSWLRQSPVDDDGFSKQIIYDKPEGTPYYGTNWLVFYYVN